MAVLAFRGVAARQGAADAFELTPGSPHSSFDAAPDSSRANPPTHLPARARARRGAHTVFGRLAAVNMMPGTSVRFSPAPPRRRTVRSTRGVTGVGYRRARISTSSAPQDRTCPEPNPPPPHVSNHHHHHHCPSARLLVCQVRRPCCLSVSVRGCPGCVWRSPCLSARVGAGRVRFAPSPLRFPAGRMRRAAPGGLRLGPRMPPTRRRRSGALMPARPCLCVVA